MKKSLLLCLLAAPALAFAQPAKYSAANVHAHNDYEHNTPFTDAHRLQLGSIEADVFLVNDSLFVAHTLKSISRSVLLDGAYLSKLNDAVENNRGFPYADRKRVLQLLIDLKTDSLRTLRAVIAGIMKYPSLVRNPGIRFVITGNQVPAAQFGEYPEFILFDGNLDNTAHQQQLARIGLFSANFARFSKWKGEGELPAADKALLEAAIAKAHGLGKQIRFWGVPDTPHTWEIMMKMGVDYINTDRIAEAVRFVEGR